MSRRSVRPNRTPLPVDAFAEFDVATIVDLFERECQDDERPYWKAYLQMFERFLEQESALDADRAENAKALHNVDAVNLVLESCARRAGFVMGFAFCRSLLLGEGAHPGKQPTGGAR